MTFLRIFLPLVTLRPQPSENGHSVGVKFHEAEKPLPRYVVFYPIKPQEKPQTTSWVPYGDSRYVTEFAKNIGLPQCFLGHLNKAKIEACEGGQALEESERRYVVFSHGLHGHQTMYSTMAMEFASRGYHVVCPEHTDGSASFTIDSNGTPVCFTPVTGMSTAQQLDYRYKQLTHRTQEMLQVLEHATPDASEIVLAGHSFGGCTALNALCELSIQKFSEHKDENHKVLLEKFKKVQHTMIFDLWPFALTGRDGMQKLESMKSIAKNSPYLKHNIPHTTLLNSEDWDDWDEVQKWASNTFFQDVNLFPEFFQRDFFPYTDHYSISDMGLFTPIFGRKKKPYGIAGRRHIREWVHDCVDFCKTEFKVV